MIDTQPLLGLHRVPAWPRLAAVVRGDGTGTLTINGTSRACAAESVTALRTGMIARAVALGNQLHRPVRLDVTENGQTHALAIRPEGYVQLVDADGTIPPVDGLSIDEGRCRICRRLQPVTSTTCVQCDAEEPLRVEVEPSSKAIAIAPTPAPPITRAAARELDELDDVQQTRISRRTVTPALPQRPTLHLTFSTTPEAVDVLAPITIGREPEIVDGGDTLTVSTPGRMLSRTHATIDIDDAGHIIVTDLHSANGIELRSSPPRWLTPGEPTVIPEGSTIVLGDVDCTIGRAQ